MTSNEQCFNNYVNDAIAIYNRATEAKSSKNIIRLANKTLKTIDQAIDLAPIIKAKEKIPYLTEFVTLSHALIADKFAQKIFFSAKKLENSMKALKYLIKIKDVFIESKNLDFINKSYSEMLKICKKKETVKENPKIVAEIYDDYAKYVYIVLKKTKNAVKYYSKAENIFKELDLKNEAQIKREKIEKINKK
ncbi:hypothetical protein ES708_16108 [subsurface metagenome]